MDSAAACEQPSALGCVMRRSVAKAIDLGVAIVIAQGLAAGLIDQHLRFDGLVPFFASAGWLLGVFLAVDAVLALALGATVGEFAMGLRVVSQDHRRLSLTERQDRTTDALVEGTLGCVPLLGAFWRRERAPYDASCRVIFQQLEPPRVAVTVLVAATVVCTAAALATQAGRSLLSSAMPPRLVGALAQLGLNVGEVWRNSHSGVSVKLPEGWQVSDVEQFGTDAHKVAFRRPSQPACQVDLYRRTSDTLLLPKPAIEALPAMFISRFGIAVDADAFMPYEIGRDGPELFQDLRQYDGFPAGLDATSATDAPTVSLHVWFTRMRHTWVLLNRLSPDCADSSGTADLVMSLIASTQPGK